MITRSEDRAKKKKAEGPQPFSSLSLSFFILILLGYTYPPLSDTSLPELGVSSVISLGCLV